MTETVKRFLDKIEITDTGCWEWTASRFRNGYGQYQADGFVLAHRFAYATFVGPIPPGMELDHLCRVRHCVNPDHLEPVTHRENGLRGTGASARNAHKTHCVNGHPFDAANTIIDAGARRCRTCKNAQLREAYRRRRKAA